jgi:hypothetical protein
MSLDAVERQGMPFVGETGDRAAASLDRAAALLDRPPDRSGLPGDAGLAERLAEARRRAAEHRDHESPRAPRAPRPPRMSR